MDHRRSAASSSSSSAAVRKSMAWMQSWLFSNTNDTNKNDDDILKAADDLDHSASPTAPCSDEDDEEEEYFGDYHNGNDNDDESDVDEEMALIRQQPPRSQLVQRATVGVGNHNNHANANNDDYSSTMMNNNIATPMESSPSREKRWLLNNAHADWKRLAIGATGILSAYLLYGHVQEDLFRYRPPMNHDNGTTLDEPFRFVWCLQVLESFVNAIVGYVGQRVAANSGSNSKDRPRNPHNNILLRTMGGQFFGCGVSQVLAKALTSLSLHAGLSFPICTLAKSAKMVPVMLGQYIMGGSVYAQREYLQALAIVGGTALLSLAESGKARNHDSSSSMAGVGFILLSLVLDGVTAGLQKRLKRDAAQANLVPTAYDFMLYVNLSMGVTAALIGTVLSNDLMDGLAYLQQHSHVRLLVAGVCFCSALGQSFIFYIIANFDPLICATITTTRKILSVGWSLVYRGHVLTPGGSLGLGVAVLGLIEHVRTNAQKNRQPQRNNNNHHPAIAPHHHAARKNTRQSQRRRQRIASPCPCPPRGGATPARRILGSRRLSRSLSNASSSSMESLKKNNVGTSATATASVE